MIWMTSLLILGLAACDTEESKTLGPEPTPTADTPAGAMPDGHPAIDGAGGAAAPSGAGFSGTVAETIDAGSYTYVRITKADGSDAWAAAPTVAVQVGQVVTVPDGLPMANHHSKTLNRDFDLVYFVSGLTAGAAAGAASGPASASPHGAAAASGVDPSQRISVPAVDRSAAAAIDGEKTVADIYANKAAYSGKLVRVRGEVVKVTNGVMGSNWAHLVDGSQAEGGVDLTITTSATVSVGDKVVASGVVMTDQDFGHGYAYDVLMVDAEFAPQ